MRGLRHIFVVGFEKIFMWHVFRIVSKFGFAGLAAMLLRSFLKKEKIVPGSSETVRLLLLSKPFFSDDVHTCFDDAPHVELYSLDVVRIKALKAISSVFLPPSLHDYNYLSDDPKVESAKVRYRNFLGRVWDKMDRKMHFDAVLTGNFAYYSERELAVALEERGLPFIVLQKENMKTTGLVDFYRDIYRSRRGPFGGRKIFVYNEIEMQIEIEAGIVPPEKVAILGMPRLDRAHHYRERCRENDGEKIIWDILFLFFGPKVGLPQMPTKFGITVQDRWQDLGWWNLSINTLHAVLDLAKKRPDIRILIKTKGDISKEKNLPNTSEFPANVEIVSGGDGFQYIRKSRVICGFTTTGLLEAIAAGKSVVVPSFDEASEELMKPYLFDFGGTVEYADSKDDLIETLQQCLDDKGKSASCSDLNSEQKRVLWHWTGNADGLSGRRVREALLREISA